MKILAIKAIEFYQRFLSPHKGFRCAHAALHNGDSCSTAIKKIVLQYGIFSGYTLIRKRFLACKHAYIQLQHGKTKKKKKNKCDVCDCDVFSCIPGKNCDLPDLPCDCSF